jgi:hypothetical protein
LRREDFGDSFDHLYMIIVIMSAGDEYSDRSACGGSVVCLWLIIHALFFTPGSSRA